MNPSNRGRQNRSDDLNSLQDALKKRRLAPPPCFPADRRKSLGKKALRNET